MELPFLQEIRALTIAGEQKKQVLTPGIAEAIIKAANEGHFATRLDGVKATSNDRLILQKNGYTAEWEQSGLNEQSLKVIWK